MTNIKLIFKCLYCKKEMGGLSHSAFNLKNLLSSIQELGEVKIQSSCRCGYGFSIHPIIIENALEMSNLAVKKKGE